MKKEYIHTISIAGVAILLTVLFSVFAPTWIMVAKFTKSLAVFLLTVSLFTDISVLYKETLSYFAHITLWQFAKRNTDIQQPDLDQLDEYIRSIIITVSCILAVFLI